MGGSGAALGPPRTLIVSMSLRPGIPWRVALQQSPLPLPRLGLSCDDTVVKARLLQRMATCPFFGGLNKRPHSKLPLRRGTVVRLRPCYPEFPCSLQRRGTGTTGSMAKMRLPGSISRATALNSPSPTASQRTDPVKSDISAAGNAWSMSQDVYPLASRGMLAASRSTPSRPRSPSQGMGGVDDLGVWARQPPLAEHDRKVLGCAALSCSRAPAV